MRFYSLVLGAVFLTACLTTPPPHPRALECNELCAQFVAVNDLTRAEVQCDLGLQFSPQYADLWVNKGLIALRRAQNEQAKEHFIKALRYNQEQAQAYNNLGYVYYKNKEYGKAHDNFQRALKVNPDYTEARYNLALTFKDLGKKEKAQKEFRTLVAVNPNLADPHHWLGVMALEAELRDEAIDELQKAVALDSTYADAWMNLGVAFMEAGRYAEAKDAFGSCLEADESLAPCRNNLAIAVRKGALLEPALRDIADQASTQKTASSMLALAKTYRDKGLKNEEELAYRKCVKLDGKYAPCHFGLFELYQESRRDKEAVIACKNFVRFAVAEDFPKQVESCEKYLGASGN